MSYYHVGRNQLNHCHYQSVKFRMRVRCLHGTALSYLAAESIHPVSCATRDIVSSLSRRLLARALQDLSDPYCHLTCLYLTVCVSATLMLNI